MLFHNSEAGFTPVLVASPALLLAALTVPFPPLCFTESNALLFAVGKEKTLLPYITQHPLSLNLLPKALE